MNFYKFINEHKIEKYSKEKSFVVYNNMIIANPTEETLKNIGYKELVVEAEPEYDIETQYLVEKYVDGEVITKTWEVVVEIKELESGE